MTSTEETKTGLDWFICILPFLCYVLALVSSWYFKRQRRLQSTEYSTTNINYSTTNTETYTPILKQWTKLVNEQRDVYPHLVLLGSTGSGKTTLCKAILASREGLCIALVAKREDSSVYPATVTYDKDGSLTALLSCIESLTSLIRTREATDTQLTIIIEDYPMLCSEKELRQPLTDLVLRVARVGRSLGIRLILIAQESTGKATGFEGQVAALQNFLTIRCHRKSYSLTIEDCLHTIPSKEVWSLSKRPTRVLPYQSTGVKNEEKHTSMTTDITDIEAVSSGMVLDTRDTAILALLSLGISANKIHETIKGDRNSTLQRIKELKELYPNE
jgi:energy-coupling factor transporter ATP-binding protein EcfA2